MNQLWNARRNDNGYIWVISNETSLDNPKIDLTDLYKQVDNKKKEIRLIKIENEIITRENVNMKEALGNGNVQQQLDKATDEDAK